MVASSLAAPRPTTVALVIAHPGHELRVFRWMEQTRPMVCILTDGSGTTGLSRVESTRRIVQDAGATMGPWQGRVRDAEVYQWLLSRSHSRFLDLVDELAGILMASGVHTVAADAAEGFNPAHDVCRLIVNATLARVASAGRAINSYEFALDRSPTAPAPASGGRIDLTLDDDALDRKLRAADDYPELKSEVARALAMHGRVAFKAERLWRVANPFELTSQYVGSPAYERYGADRVAAGVYSTAITFTDHMAPLVRALERMP